MSKLFQKIIALMLCTNIKFELNRGINNNYYLVKLEGSEIVWELDDHPDEDTIYLYDECDNRSIYATAVEYVCQVKYAEYRFYLNKEGV